MGGDAGDMLKQVAGYGVGTLSALSSLRGGGLQNYFINRQRQLEDPAFRATLVDSPFTAGVFGVGHGDAPTGALPVAQPADGTPASAGAAAPGDVRYLPAGGHWYPALSPLDYESQVKAEQDRSTMIGLTSADPAIRTQSKLSVGVPLTNAEQEQAIGRGRTLVGMAGPGSQVQYKLPGGAITVGSPYIAGNYMDPHAAAVVAQRTGKVVVPGSVPGTYDVKDPEKPAEGEYLTKQESDAGLQPNEASALTGRTVNGMPTWYRRKVEPAGVAPLAPEKPAAAPSPARAPKHAAPAPAAPAATPAAPPAAPPAAAAPSPAPEEQAAPAPPAPAPAAPAPPPPPPHEVVIQNPDGSFSPAKRAAPPPPPRAPVAPRAAAPRAEATPSTAPPLLAAAAPSPFAFPGVETPPVAAAAPPVMVARAEAPPYQLVPGSELSGVASGAPPAPAEERGPPPPPVPPAPTGAVPFAQPAAGQPGPATHTPNFPPGSETFTETTPHPANVGGSRTVTGQVPGAEERQLDIKRREAEIAKDVEARFGNIPEAKDLKNAYVARASLNDILNEYTPEQRADYLGYITPWLKSFGSANDPRYQHFLSMNDDIRSVMAGLGMSKEAIDAAPTGMERTPAEYEQKLRSAVDRVDKMISGQSTLANMHTVDLTPAQQQKVINQYMSGPATVHYGPYPWDEKTGDPISTQKTPTSAPTTTTTLYPVDRRYTVQPSAR